MTLDLSKFAGTTPYASERFGIYQPLLGWKGRQTTVRVNRAVQQLTGSLIQAMVNDGLVKQAAKGDGLTIIGPEVELPGRAPGPMLSKAATQVAQAVTGFVHANGRRPERVEWDALVRGALVSAPSGGRLPPGTVSVEPLGLVFVPKNAVTEADAEAMRAHPVPGTDVMVARSGALNHPEFASSKISEKVTAGVLQHLAEKNVSAIDAIFAGALEAWVQASKFIDPLADFDPESQLFILSPIGLVQLYQEYFFEFDTFLGPPVGHVWILPGSSVELFETHTRKTIEERQIESTVETMTSSERQAVEEDELSNAVSTQNTNNVSAGLSWNAGVSLKVFKAQAGGSLALSSTQVRSEQSAHRQTRTQSEKLSSEIRNNYKTTFRSSVETTDTSSRRYILQNPTDKTVNVELRRKMRQVGVQVKHTGSQLCWQVYIDDPGRGLGIAELVHVAAPDDGDTGVQPPLAVTPLEPKTTQYTAAFHFEGRPNSEGDVTGDNDQEYWNGRSDPSDEDGEDDWIVYKRKYTPDLPGTGYLLNADHHSIVEIAIDSPDEGDDPIIATPHYWISKDRKSFAIHLQHVDFNERNVINFHVQLAWDPPPISEEAKKAYDDELTKYHSDQKKAQHAAFIKELRERTKLASAIAPRASDDLRTEERTLIYRRLLRQLTSIMDVSKMHLTAELINAIFDIDAMLYFVAPEWWTPRVHYHQQPVGGGGPNVNAAALAAIGSSLQATMGSQASTSSTGPEDEPETVLTRDDRIAWGGAAAMGRDNYLITEDSAPAKTGASLGWLLELDGDDHRNAFLNSPWVKAVVPIRPGREEAALNWLMLAHVEGTDGLDAAYAGSDLQLEAPHNTIVDALRALAKQVTALNNDPSSMTASDKVWETGFDPLEGGFQATGIPFETCSQWVEVLPTDQVVAVDYDVGQL
jgi:hypothetical protein